MSKNSFFEALRATIPATEVADKGGLSYLAAATAVRLAGMPEVSFVDFDGQPHLACLNGSLVAVDLTVPGTPITQRMWLPVMDRDNNTLPLNITMATDINNSRQRCLVKAIASVYGVGMSLFMGCAGEGEKAAAMLGLTPDSDLATATPVVAKLAEGGAPYIEWNVGLAACRITDPTFHWEVVMWHGLPYREVLGGVMVDVDTVYQGKRQRLSLPLMDGAFNPIPVDKATVFDWNKAVMRALTKCIAFNSGYGLGVYADEFGSADSGSQGSRSRKSSSSASRAPAPAPEKTAEAPAAAPVASAPAAPAPAPAAPAPAAAPVASATEASESAPAPAPTETPARASGQSGTDAASPVADAVARFRTVMKTRQDTAGVAGVLTLFEALTQSTRFEEAHKPACFAVLVPAAVALCSAEGERVVELVANIKTYNAMQYLPAGNRDMVAARLTATMLQAACAAGDEALATAPMDLVSAGVAIDVADVLRLAKLGNVAQETLDLLLAVMEPANA